MAEDRWHVTRELLGGVPDTNSRFLNYGGATVITFNTNHAPWPKWKDKIVNRIADDFQALEGDEKPAKK